MPDTLFENNTTQNGDHQVAQTGWFAQGFTPSTTHDITSVDVLVRRQNTPGTVLVEIYGDNSNEPDIGSGTLAAGSFDADLITDVSPGVELNVLVSGAGSELAASTKYWLLLRLQDEGLSGQWVCRWRAAITGNPYAGGNLVFSFDGGSSWTQRADQDFWFKEYGLSFLTKTFTADAKLSQDGVLKTFTADASLVKQNTKTFTADANTVRLKTFTADANLFKESIPKTFTADAGILKVATKTFAVDAHVYVVPDDTWPQARAEAYDPDKLWDEETKSWYSPTSSIGVNRMAQAGGRLRSQLVVVSDQGKVFFGSF